VNTPQAIKPLTESNMLEKLFLPMVGNNGLITDHQFGIRQRLSTIKDILNNIEDK
jgi:hypothetical protein